MADDTPDEGRTLDEMVEANEARARELFDLAMAEPGIADTLARFLAERRPDDRRVHLTACFDGLGFHLEQMSEALEVVEAHLANATAMSVDLRTAVTEVEPGQGIHPRDIEAAEMHFSAVAVMVAKCGQLRRFVDFWQDVPVLSAEWDGYRELALELLR